MQEQGASGLEILNRQQEWSPCPRCKPQVVVKLGDLMERWTNGRWVSSLHRVVPPEFEKNTSTRGCPWHFFSSRTGMPASTTYPPALIPAKPPKTPASLPGATGWGDSTTRSTTRSLMNPPKATVQVPARFVHRRRKSASRLRAGRLPNPAGPPSVAPMPRPGGGHRVWNRAADKAARPRAPG